MRTKYTSSFDESLHDRCLAGCAEMEFGDSCDWFYYAWFIRHDGSFYIVREDGRGFIDVLHYELASEVYDDWNKMEEEWEKANAE